MSTLYLCNGKCPTCYNKSYGCYLYGGECRYTTNAKYAKNFEKEN